MFILDTDTCIYTLKQDENLLQQFLSTPCEDVLLSVITEAELRTGAAESGSPVKTLHLVENFLRALTLIDFTSDDAIAYAGVCAKLKRAGTPIGPLDTSSRLKLSDED